MAWMRAWRVAAHDGGRCAFEPFEEAGIAEQAVFRHLGIARRQLAPRQRVEQARCR